MRGSIQKKGDIYYVVVAIGTKRKWFRGGTTKKDAERVLTEKLGEIDKKHAFIFPRLPSLSTARYGLVCTPKVV